MAGVNVDRASMVRVARNLGKQGKPLPPEMEHDPEFKAAHAEGAGQPPAPAPKPASAHPLVRRRPATPAKTPSAPANPATPASKGIIRRASTRLWGGASRTNAGLGRGRRLAAKAIPGGTGGGVLLTVVVYPLGLSIIKYGPAGPWMWFRAKWLNQTSDTAAGGTGAGKIQGPIVGKGTGPRQRGGAAGTPRRLPQ